MQRIIISLLLLINCAAHSMELVPLISVINHRFQINGIQDMPKLSLIHMAPCFNILPESKRKNILITKNRKGIPLAESLTFNIAMLQEGKLIYHILIFMMDGDEKSAELFYNTPLLYAHTRYDQARKMIEKSSLKINKPISLLFRLSAEQQKEIMGFVTKSSISKITDSIITIDEDKHEKIKGYEKEIQENFFAKENIVIMTENIKRERNYNQKMTTLFGGLTGILFGFLIGTATTVTLPPHYNCSNNSSNVCFERSVLPFLAPPIVGYVLGSLIGRIYHTIEAKKKAPILDIDMKK